VEVPSANVIVVSNGSPPAGHFRGTAMPTGRKLTRLRRPCFLAPDPQFEVRHRRRRGAGERGDFGDGEREREAAGGVAGDGRREDELLVDRGAPVAVEVEDDLARFDGAEEGGDGGVLLNDRAADRRLQVGVAGADEGGVGAARDAVRFERLLGAGEDPFGLDDEAPGELDDGEARRRGDAAEGFAEADLDVGRRRSAAPVGFEGGGDARRGRARRGRGQRQRPQRQRDDGRVADRLQRSTLLLGRSLWWPA
jgi:hypothetical protein